MSSFLVPIFSPRSNEFPAFNWFRTCSSYLNRWRPFLFFLYSFVSYISLNILSSFVLWRCTNQLSCLFSIAFSIGFVFSCSSTRVFLTLFLHVVPSILCENLMSTPMILLCLSFLRSRFVGVNQWLSHYSLIYRESELVSSDF